MHLLYFLQAQSKYLINAVVDLSVNDTFKQSGKQDNDAQ